MQTLGLTEQEAQRQRRKYGANVLTKQKRKGFFRQYLSSFSDPIIRILLVALAVNLIFMFRSSAVESVGIALAVFVSTFLSTLSSYSGETAFLELEKATFSAVSKVYRNGKIRELPVSEIVVGDRIYLTAGEKIYADGELVFGELNVDESALSGESTEQKKKANDPKRNRLLRGTTVLSGEGEMIVKKVGDETFYGRLAQGVQEDAPKSPLHLKLTALAKTLSKIGYVSAALIAVADLINAFLIDNRFDLSLCLQDIRTPSILFSNLLHALTLAIATIVVAVPEGLPMMIAVVLSSNTKKMQKAGVLVKKPVGIESAGGMNILFTDKTGTLTKGELAVMKFMDGEGNDVSSFLQLRQFVRETASLCIVATSEAKVGADGKFYGGNATDRVLRQSVPSVSLDGYEILEKTPFTSEEKTSSAVVRTPTGEKIKLIKGAPERILDKCVRSVQGELDKEKIRRKLTAWTRDAMRVIALAKGDEEYTLIALIAIRDEIRKEVPSAVAEAFRGGIQVVMITGDNLETAKAVGRDVGLFTGPTGADGEYVCLDGTQMEKMSDKELSALLPALRIVARALPTDKSRLVRLAQKRNYVVGMTGDGINDAPALKNADVGFSMGSGTEVAKEAGDVVILDNNFASITKASLFGRTIFRSIRKFIVFQLTMNFCAVGVSLIAPFIRVDTPITVIQMLWINMIMDTLASLAFAGEPALKEYMDEPPTGKTEKVLNKNMIQKIAWTGGYIVALSLLFLKLPVFKRWYRFDENPTVFYTAFFALFVFSGVFNSFNARTERIKLTGNLKANRNFTVFIFFVLLMQLILMYFGGKAFRCTPLSFSELLGTVVLSLTVFPVDLSRKLLFLKTGKKHKEKLLFRQSYGSI